MCCSFCYFWGLKSICCFMRVKNTQRKIVTPSSFQSMEGAQMLVHLLKIQTIILMSTQILLMNLWTEHQKNLLSDSWRIGQLQKHLSREDHPFHRFNTGNMDTLHARPEANGVDTRTELIKFYEEHYSANIMHLVVYGKENLDEIQGIVEEKFHEIPNTNKDIPRFPGQPCAPDHLQVLVKAVPIRQGHSLIVSWPVTPSIHHYEEAPCWYLGHLIGHEGEGSLFYALKILGWTTSLCADEGDWTMEYYFFTVSISFTDAGHEHVQDIIGLLFRNIELLQQSDVYKWIFDEIYPIKHWLVGSSLPSKFNPASVERVLSELSPNNVRIFWISNKFEGNTDKVEPWYNTAYSLEKLTESTIQEWVQSAPDVNLCLPTPNVFIPTDFSLKDFEDKDSFPVLLRKTSFSRLWYKPVKKFFRPKAFVKMEFICPAAFSSPDILVLSMFFISLMVDYLNEHAYYAEVAGLDYGLSLSANGFELSLGGFNHKMRILLEAVIEKMANFEVKPDRFSVIKETVIKAYQNYKFRQPYSQAMTYCSMILQDLTWPWTEELDALSHLEAGDLAKFVPMLLSRTFVECYIAGNVDKNEAESMVKHIEDVLFNDPKPISRPLFPSQLPTNRVAELGTGRKYFYHQEGSNPNDENSALLHYIQVYL